MRTKTEDEASHTRLIEANPGIDRELVRNFAALEDQLQKLGVETRPRYSLNPPLGDRPIHALHFVPQDDYD